MPYSSMIRSWPKGISSERESDGVGGEELNPDIICCGARAVDYDQAQRGAMMAEFLGWPHLALAVVP